MLQHKKWTIVPVIPIGEFKISENEKKIRTLRLSKIHCGNRSPTKKLEKNDNRINLKEELDFFAKGQKTLKVSRVER